jgi:hypothetical protein
MNGSTRPSIHPRHLLSLCPTYPDDFIEDLDRLVDDSPAAVCRVLDAALKGYKPDYDFEGRLKKLLRKLALRQETRNDALRLAERLVRQLPGMVEFYQEITSLQPA